MCFMNYVFRLHQIISFAYILSMILVLLTVKKENIEDMLCLLAVMSLLNVLYKKKIM
jgi:hypothetical protein